MKKKYTGNIVVFLVLFCAIALSLNAGEKNLQTNIDYIECEDLIVQALTECPAKPEDISLATCTQHFIFKDRKNESMTAARNNMDAFAWSWGCIQGKNGSYLIIEYATGGTCQGCEWIEIWSSNGKLIASDNTRDMKSSQAMKKIKKFKSLYTRLGLPKKYPHDSFISMGILKIEKTGTGD